MQVVGAVMCRDEATNIEACLTSLLTVGCQGLCVLDTGSVDGTQDLVRGVMRRAGLSGYLWERPFTTYGAGREALLECCRDVGAEYALMIDGDCTVDGQWTQPAYDLCRIPIVVDDVLSERFWVMRLSKRWYYETPELHEMIFCRDASFTVGSLRGLQVTHHGVPGSRRDPEEELRHYRAQAEAHPQDSRWPLYIGQTMKGLGRMEEAADAYRHAASLGDIANEWCWWCHLQVAVITNDIPLMLDLSRRRPHRPEPLYQLSILLREQGDLINACRCAQAAAALPVQVEGFFVSLHVHRWGAMLEWLVCLGMLGRFDDARLVGQLLLERDIPEEVRSQTLAMVASFPTAAAEVGA